MREDLLENSEGLRVQKTRTDCKCAYSGNIIPEGKHGLLLRMHDSRDNSTSVYSTWVSIKEATNLRNSLIEYDFENNTPREEISPCGSISYSKVKGETISCLVCEKSIPKDSEGIAFVNYTNRHRSRTAWSHTYCISKLCDGIDNIQEHLPKLLSETI